MTNLEEEVLPHEDGELGEEVGKCRPGPGPHPPGGRGLLLHGPVNWPNFLLRSCLAIFLWKVLILCQYSIVLTLIRTAEYGAALPYIAHCR